MYSLVGKCPMDISYVHWTFQMSIGSNGPLDIILIQYIHDALSRCRFRFSPSDSIDTQISNGHSICPLDMHMSNGHLSCPLDPMDSHMSNGHFICPLDICVSIGHVWARCLTAVGIEPASFGLMSNALPTITIILPSMSLHQQSCKYLQLV